MSFVMSMLLTTATVAVPSHAPTLPGAPAKPATTSVAPVSTSPGAPLGAPSAASTPVAGQVAGGHIISGQATAGQVASPSTPASSVAKPAAPAAAPAADPLMAIERQIVQQTNTHRTRHGLRPLQIDLRLMQSARRHAAWMASRRLMQHGRAAVAENIAAGQSSPGEAVRDWMNSSGHRANILNSRYSRIGVAAYRGPDGQVYWCQQFLW